MMQPEKCSDVPCALRGVESDASCFHLQSVPQRPARTRYSGSTERSIPPPPAIRRLAGLSSTILGVHAG